MVSHVSPLLLSMPAFREGGEEEICLKEAEIGLLERLLLTDKGKETINLKLISYGSFLSIADLHACMAARGESHALAIVQSDRVHAMSRGPVTCNLLSTNSINRR